MIRLIKDIVYTMKVDGVAVDKTINSEPFETSPSDEEMLISKGFAEKVKVEVEKASGADEAEKTTQNKAHNHKKKK